MGKRAVFLDRDGTIVKATVCNGRPFSALSMEEFKILPEAKGCCDRLKAAGYELIVVTNQPEVARGNMEQFQLDLQHRDLMRVLPLTDILVCEHDAHNCGCRKPSPGLLWKAAKKHDVNLRSSFMVGDRWSDVQAGWFAYCKTAWIDRGYDEKKPSLEMLDFRCESLEEATKWILSQST